MTDKMMSRRSFLAGTAGSMVALAGTGAFASLAMAADKSGSASASGSASGSASASASASSKSASGSVSSKSASAASKSVSGSAAASKASASAASSKASAATSAAPAEPVTFHPELVGPAGSYDGKGNVMGMEVVPDLTPVDADSIDWDYEADIVILGAGGAGLPAALRALDAGCSVMFVDANYDVGGRAALSGGNLHCGAGTEIQKEYGIDDSADLYYQDHTAYQTLQARYNDRDYVRAVADSMADAFAYILDKGVIIKDTEPMKLPDWTEGGDQPETVARWTYSDQTAEDWTSYADGLTPSTGGLVDRCGVAYTRPLERSCREAGAQFLLNYHMDKIYREGVFSGRAFGIQAHYTPTILPDETEPLTPLMDQGNVSCDKDTVNVKADKAIIICTGGSTGNIYFRTMIDPRRGVEYDCTSGDPFCPKDGSGEVAAMAIGASLNAIADQVAGDSFLSKAAMIGTQYTDSFATVMPTSPLFQLSRATGLRVYDWTDLLMVNMLGERFCNETLSDTEGFNAPALASVLVTNPDDGELHRYGGPLWTIFDADAVTNNGWTIDDTTVDKADGRFFQADTLEELAAAVVNKYYESIPMDADTLVATVKRYNEMVDAGKDDDFGKEGMTAKIQTPPFYAAWSTPGFHDTTTGLRVNRKMQVMDLYDQVIPGLYCAGESSGGMRIHGLGRVVVSGYIAGASAAEEA